MRYELKIAYKFLLFNKKQTLFLLSAISMGVAVQLFISSIIVSLQKDLIGSVLGNTPHIVIQEGQVRNQLLKDEFDAYTLGNFPIERDRVGDYKNIIESLTKIWEFKNIVYTLNENAIYRRQGKSSPVTLIAVDLDNADSLYNIKERITLGNPHLYSDNLIIGQGIRREYSLSIGDTMDLTLSNGNIFKGRVSGVVDLENQQSNNSFVFLELKKGQQILDKKGYVSNINLQIFDVFKAETLSESLKKSYKDLKITPWTEDGKSLLLALKAQTSSSIVIQFVVTLATSLSIVSVLFITVIQKSKEIGILKAMGTKDRSSGLIFIYQGGIIGFLGAIIGVVLGYLIILFYTLGVNPPFIIEIDRVKVILIIVISTFSAMLAAYFPAKKCMRLNPIEVIRGD